MQVDIAAMVLLLAVGVFAGSIGALVGIGGGIIIVPALALGFGYDIRTSVATSLVAVVATSAAAGMKYAQEGLTNIRLGLTLEVVTAVGGVVGGLIAVSIAPNVIYGVFALVTLLVAVLMWRHDDERRHPSQETVGSLRAGSDILRSSYVDQATRRQIEYRPRRLGFGMSLSSVAGVLSGLLGVGGGFLKVPAMTLAMDVPAKAAAATSNFMVGITAVASLVIYLARGFVQPAVAVPVTLGIVLGAVVMSQFTNKVSGLHVQRVLSVILVIIAVQMALESAGLVAYG
ncbi:MAG: sulfite exporter TauE/SafE family protein [Acidimicrobiia bacterium]